MVTTIHDWFARQSTMFLRVVMSVSLTTALVLAMQHAAVVDSNQAMDSIAVIGPFKEDSSQLVAQTGRVRTNFDANPEFNTGTRQANQPTTPQAVPAECECENGCKCLDPAICERGHCLKSYAILFTTALCRPCDRMKPVVQQLRDNDYIVYMRNLSDPQYAHLAKSARIDRVPLMIIFEGGKEVTRLEGVVQYEAITARMKPRKHQNLDSVVVPLRPETKIRYNLQ